MRAFFRRLGHLLLALPGSVPLRISLPVLLLVVPALLSGLVLQREVRAVRGRVEQQALSSLREALRDDQRRIETLAVRGEVELIREEVAALGVDPQLELILVARSDGAVLAANRLRLIDLPIEEALTEARLPEPASLDAELEAARVLGEPQARLSKSRDQVLGFYPLQLGGGGRDGAPASSGVMFAVRSMAGARARAVRVAVLALLPPIGLLLGISFFVWLWFHGALARRVRHLVEATREVAADGCCRARARMDGSDELARIGNAFDEMVDALEKSQQQARMNDRLATVGTLASGVAHEINNPLAYAIANLDFAHAAVSAKGPLEGAERTELAAALAEALEGARRVRGIAGDLKMLSRREGDALGPVDARAVLESALNIAGQEIRQRARVVRRYGEVPLVHGDAGRLGQVALNLLINAAQALPKDAADQHEIRVCTALVADQIALDIEDTGPGIPAAVLPRIFDPFFTTKPVGEGTGLGLSICASLVASMGGRIEVETAAGKGTRFRVWLRPAAPVSAREAPRSPPALPQASPAAPSGFASPVR